jgi:hypothetical protein
MPQVGAATVGGYPSELITVLQDIAKPLKGISAELRKIQNKMK